MNQSTSGQREAIEGYLRSGDYDTRFAAWPGNNLVAQERLGRDALKQERGRLVDELAESAMLGDEVIDSAEVIDILREASAARNGWKRILARCAPAPRRRALKTVQSAQPDVHAPTADARRALEGRSK